MLLYLLLKGNLLSVLMERVRTLSICSNILGWLALINAGLLHLLLGQIIILSYYDWSTAGILCTILHINRACKNTCLVLLLLTTSIRLSWIFLEFEQGVHVRYICSMVWGRLTLIVVLIGSIRILYSLWARIGTKVYISKSKSPLSAGRQRHFCLNKLEIKASCYSIWWLFVLIALVSGLLTWCILLLDCFGHGIVMDCTWWFFS
jgi:hypothetical protein